MPIRLLIGPGLILVGAGLLLMRGLNAQSGWTHLIPGMILGGARSRPGQPAAGLHHYVAASFQFLILVMHRQVLPVPRPETRSASQIGATETPSIGLADGGAIHLNSSLALGAEYDRQLLGCRTALYGGIDFVASPLDVKASFPAANLSPEYAYLFLTPNVRLKFNQGRSFAPWLLFGGGYADFSPAQPRAGGVNVAGAGSTGTLEFGGGLDTKPVVRLKRHSLDRSSPDWRQGGSARLLFRTTELWCSHGWQSSEQHRADRRAPASLLNAATMRRREPGVNKGEV